MIEWFSDSLYFISVNIAGVNIVNATEAIGTDVMKRVFDINFFGTVRVAQEVLPIMKKQRSGRIINMGSVHDLVGMNFFFFFINGVLRST